MFEPVAASREDVCILETPMTGRTIEKRWGGLHRQLGAAGPRSSQLKLYLEDNESERIIHK